jgi:hypothetical protein
MYGDFLLLDNDSGGSRRAERLALGDTAGRDEAWLRDTILAHPELLPIRDIDPSFGPLIPLCCELRTEAGPIDAVFINAHGRLTLVECKLWRNPESRRKVVAQVLDYARALNHWSYSDLQRQVSAATGKSGNVPFELVRAASRDVREHEFVDATAVAIREGRFLLLIVGDGIRQDIQSMAELITRNATMAFSFGLVEVALYGLPDGALLAQPRVVAKTQIIQRSLVVVRDGAALQVAEQEAPQAAPAGDEEGEAANTLGESPRQAAYRRWWLPVIQAPLDDPDQDPPVLFWPNNIRLALPWPNAWILAFNLMDRGRLGVCTAGRMGADQEMMKLLDPDRNQIVAELPPGSEHRLFSDGSGFTFSCQRASASFSNDDERRGWLANTINKFVNVLRPRVKRLPGATG